MSKSPEYTGHILLQGVSLVRATFSQALFRTGDGSERLEIPADLDFSFSVSLRYNDREEGRVTVDLAVRAEHDEEVGQPYDVEVVYRGRFELRNLPEGLSKKQVAERNAAAILFPYVRETVSSLTAKGTAGPLTLPPINVVAMLEQGEKKERESVET